MMLQATPAPMSLDPAQWLQQGGLFAVLIVVLYFYRRDYAKAVEARQSMIDQLLELVKTTTAKLGELEDLGERICRELDGMNSRRRQFDRPARVSETPP